jgi:hypothetical protein
MNRRFRNPHPFDMSNYFSGLTCVVGGRDFDHEEKERPEVDEKQKTPSKDTYELDWSFLKAIHLRKINKRS